MTRQCRSFNPSFKPKAVHSSHGVRFDLPHKSAPN